MNRKTKIHFLNGMRTIGGTLIQISYGDSAIYFDFGSIFDPNLEKQPATLQEYLAHDLIPYAKGLYFEDQTEAAEEAYRNRRKNIEDAWIDKDTPFADTSRFSRKAVFLSHAHLDHTKVINLLHPDIPLFASQDTAKLLIALNEENTYLEKSPVALAPLSEQELRKRWKMEEPLLASLPLYRNEYTRAIIGVPFSQPIPIGKIKVTLLPVDHDAFGACGMWIETPDLRIAYTGDLRLHGYKRNATITFCERVKGCDVLISEGVSVSSQEIATPEEEEKAITEAELMDQLLASVKENPKKNLSFHYYIANIERILSLIERIAPFREVVLEAYHASVLKKLTGKEVRYYRLKKGKYALDPEKEIPFTELVSDRARFFWQLDTAALSYIDEKMEDAVYYHLDAQPLGDFDPHYAPFLEWLTAHGFEYHVMKCSGHATTMDLMRIIHWIGPELLVPIHSHHPERLYSLWGNRLLPKKGQLLEWK